MKQMQEMFKAPLATMQDMMQGFAGAAGKKK
jgi:hypothetical protein